MLYTLSRTIFEILIRLLFRLRISGFENIPEPPFIVTSNHSSIIDPPIVGVACKKYHVDFMAKKELFDSPVFGAWTRRVGCIEVKRGENSIKSLKESIKRLRSGRIVGIFPEGTRSEDGSLQQAKRGTGFVISKSGVPVLPVYIHGSAQALPKGGKLRPGTAIDVFIGKPVYPAEMLQPGTEDLMSYEEISSIVMDRIADMRRDFLARTR